MVGRASQLIRSPSLAGKYCHRWRRQRPCTYTTDLETHLRFKAEADAAAAIAAETAAVASPRAATRATDADGEQRVQRAAGRPKPRIRDSSDEDSDDSDDSAAPLKNRRLRGQSPDLPFVQLGSPDSDHSSTSAPSPPATQVGGFPAPAPTSQPPAAAPASAVAPAASSSAPVSLRQISLPQNLWSFTLAELPPSYTQDPLPWMQAAAADLRAKQVDDRFEIIPRPRPPDPNLQEWRIRCLDCPGKVSSAISNAILHPVPFPPTATRPTSLRRWLTRSLSGLTWLSPPSSRLSSITSARARLWTTSRYTSRIVCTVATSMRGSRAASEQGDERDRSTELTAEFEPLGWQELKAGS